WGALLSQGESRAAVALGILRSVEADQLHVNELYLGYLLRDAEPGGLANWTAKLQHGEPGQQVLAEILALPEYAALAQQMSPAPDAGYLPVPGTTGDVPSSFTLTGRTAPNEFGLFPIDDVSGRVGALSPGDAGYLRQALSQAGRRRIFAVGDP